MRLRLIHGRQYSMTASNAVPFSYGDCRCRNTRRNFLRRGTLATVLGSTAWPDSVQAANQPVPTGSADLVVLGGTVYTSGISSGPRQRRLPSSISGRNHRQHHGDSQTCWGCIRVYMMARTRLVPVAANRGPAHRVRRRSAAHRRREALLRRLRLRTHHAHEQALRRPAQRFRHPGHHAGRLNDQVADIHAQRLPGRRPRQRRRGHRHGAAAPTSWRSGCTPAPTPGPASSIARWSIPTCSNASPPSGAIPTPFYTYVYYHGDKWAQYGDERVRWMFAHRSFLDHSIKVAGGSDYVPGPFEPLMAIQSMVTRKRLPGRVWGENQKITVDEGAARLHDQRRLCVVRGKDQGLDHGRQIGRLRHSGPRTRTRPIRNDQGHPGGPHRGRRADGASTTQVSEITAPECRDHDRFCGPTNLEFPCAAGLRTASGWGFCPPRMASPLADQHAAVLIEVADQIVPLHVGILTSS